MTPQESWEVYTGFALFFASELIGISKKCKDNSLLMLFLHTAQRAFPYELRKVPSSKRYAERPVPQHVEPGETLYKEDELDALSVGDLRSIAGSLGKAALAQKGTRRELVKALSKLDF